MRSPVLLLALLLATSAQGLSRKEWLTSLRQSVSEQLCAPERYGICFSSPTPVCREKAGTELTGCFKASEKLIPAELPPLLAARWGRQLTVCTAQRLQKKLPASKAPPAKCKDLTNTPIR